MSENCPTSGCWRSDSWSFEYPYSEINLFACYCSLPYRAQYAPVLRRQVFHRFIGITQESVDQKNEMTSLQLFVPQSTLHVFAGCISKMTYHLFTSLLYISCLKSTYFIPSSFAHSDGVLSNKGYGILGIPSALCRDYVESIHTCNESSGIQ